jgi:hypothetical protein
MDKEARARAQFANEVIAVLNRWTEESDLQDEDLADTACVAISLWMDQDTVEFEADEDFFEES